MPSEDWDFFLKTAKVDYNREEIKLPEAITWTQIAPALPPADLTLEYEPLIWRKDQFVNCCVTQQKSLSRLRNSEFEHLIERHEL